MASSLQKIEGDDSVLLRVTHSNIKTFSADIRFSQQMSVESVKEKLWKKCGTSVNSMHLELYDDSNYKISDLTDNSRSLGFYSPLDGLRVDVTLLPSPVEPSLFDLLQDYVCSPSIDPSIVVCSGSQVFCFVHIPSCFGTDLFFTLSKSQHKYRVYGSNRLLCWCFWGRFRLHVIDLDPSSVTSGGWLEDTSLVEKYTISEEAYNKREGTFRKFKERLSSRNPSTAAAKVPDTSMESLCSNIKIGSRCEVEPGEKRGVVKFVGQAEALGPGLWVGVQYDEPLGKHDGMVKGVRYFECPPSHGAMIRAEKVKVGDYPERDPFEDEI